MGPVFSTFSRKKINMHCTRVYVGGLPEGVRRSDVLDMFERYGDVREVDIHDARPPYYAFVEYYDDRDAEDAVRKLDNEKLMGAALRVEFAKDRRASRCNQYTNTTEVAVFTGPGEKWDPLVVVSPPLDTACALMGFHHLQAGRISRIILEMYSVSSPHTRQSTKTVVVL